MIPPNDYWMGVAMKTYGGGFVKLLKNLLDHADHINYQKLETAFPEYFKQYRDMGFRLEENEKMEFDNAPEENI